MAAADVVMAFLDAMGRRDLDAAEALLAPGFKMVVSGGHAFRSPREFVAHSKGRQRSARKTTDRYEEIPTPGGDVVYAIGSMAGEWNDGSAYAGVRYIDRFEVRDGKIADMQVWSDMAEFRPREG
jgi:ketosteroid isomerase-like protein